MTKAHFLSLWLCLLFLGVSRAAYAAEADVALPPTTITLHVKQATPEAIFSEIGRQGHVQFALESADLWRRLRTPVDLDLEQQPFWAAMQQACQKTQVRVRPARGIDERRIMLADRGRNLIAGGTLTEHGLLEHGLLVNIDASPVPDAEGAIYVAVNVFADPRWRVVRGPMAATVLEATDDSGNSLVAREPAGTRMSYGEAWLWPVTAKLSARSGASRIAHLKATAQLMLQTEAKSVEVPGILQARDARVSVEGRELLVKRVLRSEQDYEVSVVISMGDCTRGQFEPARNPHGIRLLDANGRELVCRAVQGGEGGDAVQYTLRFTRKGTDADVPAKLVWDVPVRTQMITLPIELRDVELP